MNRACEVQYTELGNCFFLCNDLNSVFSILAKRAGWNWLAGERETERGRSTREERCVYHQLVTLVGVLL